MKTAHLIKILTLAAILPATAQAADVLHINQDSNANNCVTFSVCNVPIATAPLIETDYDSELPRRISGKIESYSKSSRKIIAFENHAFMEALYQSFNGHRPIRISPDMIWLLIAQGFSQHVENNAEALRYLFVSHEGKKNIVVRRDDFVKGKFDNPWQEVFPEFSKKVQKNLKDSTLYQTVVPVFSTTTPIEKAAFEITFLNSLKSYFTYELVTLCGIPAITLEGTASDWKKVIDNAGELRTYKLEWWIDSLTPILKNFMDASNGKIDTVFWTKMYKEVKVGAGSGSVKKINGWIVKFFPYLPANEKEVRRNPFIENVMTDKTGLSFSDIPCGISRTEFVWLYHEQVFEMKFLAGFTGFTQNKTSREIRPEIGWIIADVTNEPKSDK